MMNFADDRQDGEEELPEGAVDEVLDETDDDEDEEVEDVESEEKGWE